MCDTPAAGEAGTVECAAPGTRGRRGRRLQHHRPRRLGAADGSTITNTATIESALASDPDEADNAATAATGITTSADLVATKTGAIDVVPGGELSYALSITNDGPSDATGVEMTDALPAGTTFVSLIQDDGPAFVRDTPAVGAGGTVTCTIASLADGTTARFTLVVRLDAATLIGSTISNTIVVASDTDDPDPAANTATADGTRVLAATLNADPGAAKRSLDRRVSP